MSHKENKKKIKWYVKAIIAVAVVIAVLAVALSFIDFHSFYQDVYKPHYLSQKLKAYEKEAEKAEKGGIVFFGDSITDYCDLKKYYPQYNVFNRGISGDCTYHLLERMDDVYALEPSVVVLLIGVNDFMNEDRPVEDVVEDYSKILDELRENLPLTVVVCQSVYPGADGRFMVADHNDEIIELNKAIKELAEKNHYIYADIHPYLLAEGSDLIDSAYCKDGVHPNKNGYKVIAEHLTPYIAEAYELATMEIDFSSARIAFLGDSITRYYDLEYYYPQYNVQNHGVSGHSTFHMLERLEPIYEFDPHVVVILAGINDFMNEDREVADVAVDYEKILTELQKNCPDAEIICISVYPSAGKSYSAMKIDNNDVFALNVEIEKLCEKYGLTYVNMHPYILDPQTNELYDGYSSDGVHLNAWGYMVVSEQLMPIVEETVVRALRADR